MKSKLLLEDVALPKRTIELGVGPELHMGARIREARDNAQMTSAELHRQTRISKSSLTRYEKGERYPGTAELRLICDALNVSPQYLIYGHEETQFEPMRSELLEFDIESDEQFAALSAVLLQTLSRPDREAMIQLMISIATLRAGKDPIRRLASTLAEFADNSGEQLEAIAESAADDFARMLTDDEGS